MSLEISYSDHWKNLEDILIYQSNDFQFHSKVVITELENCLINKITRNGIYHAINPKDISIKSEKFIKEIKKDSTAASIVICSNQISQSKVSIDIVKRKLEGFVKICTVPILAIFALKSNKFAKPHTGMYKFIQGYYKKYGNSQMQKAIVVSDEGGKVIEITNKKGVQKIKYDNNDTDRAFAYNCGVEYFTISEYIGEVSYEKFQWSCKYLSPENRINYINEIKKYKNPNVFQKMASYGEVDNYMIIVLGPPRSGKTSYIKKIMEKWRNSQFGLTNCVKRLSLEKNGEKKRQKLASKYVEQRISVIIDGSLLTEASRIPYELIAEKHHIPIIYIEINPGLALAYLYNRVAVELDTKNKVTLYKDDIYYQYKSIYERPKDVLLCCPRVIPCKALMEFRY